MPWKRRTRAARCAAYSSSLNLRALIAAAMIRYRTAVFTSPKSSAKRTVVLVKARSSPQANPSHDLRPHRRHN